MVKNSHHSGDWLLKAENELKAAKAIYNYYEEPPTDMVCYHCHQTAEKALKGYLVYRQINFPNRSYALLQIPVNKRFVSPL